MESVTYIVVASSKNLTVSVLSKSNFCVLFLLHIPIEARRCLMQGGMFSTLQIPKNHNKKRFIIVHLLPCILTFIVFLFSGIPTLATNTYLK